MKQPVLLCGLGRLGLNLVGYLRAANLDVVVIDHKPRPHDLRHDGVTFLQGDIRDPVLLEKAGLAQARGVILATSDDLANIAAALQVRSMNADVRIVIRMFNQNLVARLGKSVPNVFALSVSALTAPVLALIALSGEALGGIATGSERYQISEITVASDSAWVRKTVRSLGDDQEWRIVAHTRGETCHLHHEIEADEVIRVGDRLVLCAEPGQLAPLLQADKEQDDALRWAGAVRRIARVFLRSFAQIDAPVKICLFVLLLVVGVSTLIFHFGMGRTVPDGLYRTISVLCTGADLGGRELPEGWQKVFVSVLRILGVALMAALTAIVTNYLLRVRLGSVLEMRRIPEGGHVVVCGLGNIGFRVTEELIRQGQQVVVVERDPAGKFVTTARQLGAAVLHGDATVAEVHRQANSVSARAIVAVTSDPLANLEIALLTQEWNPKQRIVVRMSDSNLAQTLRDAANVKLAFSTTALAAPAFVAALFGDRVLNIFLIEHQVLAVLDLVVEESDRGWIGARVEEMTRTHRALPVRLLREGEKVSPMAEATLALGDRLMVIVGLHDLRGLLSQAVGQADAGGDAT